MDKQINIDPESTGGEQAVVFAVPGHALHVLEQELINNRLDSSKLGVQLIASGVSMRSKRDQRGSGIGPWHDSEIAKTLRRWREDSGLSQSDVAAMVGDGATQSEISQLERGWIRAPRYQRMASFAKVMGVPLDQLLRETRWIGPFGGGANVEAVELWTVSEDPIQDLLNVAESLSVQDLATLVRLARILSIQGSSPSR